LRNGDNGGYTGGVDEERDSGNLQFYDPPTGWIGVSGFGLPYPIQIRAGVAADGRLVCMGLQAAVSAAGEDQWEVTARSLREIPLTRILVFLAEWYSPEVRALILRGVTVGDPHYRYVGPEGETANEKEEHDEFVQHMLDSAGAALDEPYDRPRVRPGPKGYPDEWFKTVAGAYRRALVEHPRGTFAALARELHASEATVRRWVQRAQDKGYLGASTPGKAGRKPREDA
jgi:hypothetical protein